MSDRRPPQIELLPDGSYRPQRPPIAARVFAWAVVIAVASGALAVAAFALWFALILIPVVVVAALIAWLAFRYQLWRARQRSWPRGGWPRGGWPRA